MRIELLGGGGVRVPHLVYRLLKHRRELDLSEILLYDAVPARAAAMAALCEALVRRSGDAPLPLRVLDRPGGGGRVDFVLTAIRPGGDRGRARDEALCREVGLLGQETTGAGGFFMALRTLGPLTEAVGAALATSPAAWVLNFTNPAGLMTEALSALGVERVIGICDTPSHALAEIEQALDLEAGALTPDYFGLNHMGFFGALTDQSGTDRLPELFERYETLTARAETLRYFAPDVVRAIGALPVEYVHFYLDRRGAVERQARAEILRGAQIEALNTALWREVEAAMPDRPDTALDAYLRTMATRNATYFATETGASRRPLERPERYLESPGYEVVALAAMRALLGGPAATLMLDVPGGGARIGADAHEVFETTVRLDSSGVEVLAGRAPTGFVRGLVGAVKAFERLALEAWRRPGRAAVLAALLAHPLVADADAARRLLTLAEAAGVEGVAGVA